MTPEQQVQRLLDALLAIAACTGRGERAHTIAVAAIEQHTGRKPQED